MKKIYLEFTIFLKKTALLGWAISYETSRFAAGCIRLPRDLKEEWVWLVNPTEALNAKKYFNYKLNNYSFYVKLAGVVLFGSIFLYAGVEILVVEDEFKIVSWNYPRFTKIRPATRPPLRPPVSLSVRQHNKCTVVPLGKFIPRSKLGKVKQRRSNQRDPPVYSLRNSLLLDKLFLQPWSYLFALGPNGPSANK